MIGASANSQFHLQDRVTVRDAMSALCGILCNPCSILGTSHELTLHGVRLTSKLGSNYGRVFDVIVAVQCPCAHLGASSVLEAMLTLLV